MGLLSGIGSVINGVGSLFGLYTQKKAADAQIQSNQDNLAFQRENFEYQKGIDQFNMDMANKQFGAQLALNERNSITGQTAEMARNGLNPLTGSGFANGSGAVSGSQVASGVQAIVAPNDFSAMSQLGETLSNTSLQKSAQNMSLAIAKLTDKNTMLDLMGKLVDKGIDPKIFEDEFKKAGLNIDFSKSGQYSGNISDVAGNNYWDNVHDTKHKARLSREEDELGHTLDYMNMKNGNPFALFEDIDKDDPKSILGGILGLIKLLK